MAWKVIEYMDENPGVPSREVIKHFAEELEINAQLKYLKQEVDQVLEVRAKLRPLYAEKMNAETNMALLESDFDMSVMMKYPPRQGSDKERKAYKKELQQNSSDYQECFSQIEKRKAEIELLEEELNETQQRAKNARRILETFNSYLNYILDIERSAAVPAVPVETNKNQNLF